MLILLLATFYLLAQAGPAQAEVIGAISTWFAGLSAGAQFVIRVAVSLGTSLLMQKKPEFRDEGVEIKYTTSGGTEPQGAVFGISDSGGHSVYRNSHGAGNRYYTHVVEYSDVPGCTLVGLIIDGVQSQLGSTEHADYGKPILSKRLDDGNDRAWVKFYDGSQTTADAMLVDRYSGDSDLPWTADHIGTGICYAIFTFDYDREQFVSEPQVRAVLAGVPFYDPREDTSVGGDGAQRFDNPATWAHTKNPLVIANHLMRGYVLPCGEVYGGAADADDLPLSNWVAAMNACDVEVGVSDRPRFRFGMEVKFHRDEPAKIIEECLASANAQIAELGGVFTVQVAEPAPAVAAITDGDILVSEATEYDPFPGFEQVFNAMVITHPDPGSLWQPKQLPVIENTDWVAEDGERRSISVELMGVPWPGQAQQVGDSMLRDERRWKRHKAPLRHSWSWLEPLHTIEWTSAWNGYEDKLFEVSEAVYDLHRGNVLVSLRERDPADLGHIEDLELPDPADATAQIARTSASVIGLTVVAETIQATGGSLARPALRVSWDRAAMGDVDGVGLRMRIDGETDIIRYLEIHDRAAEDVVIEPVLPGTDYQVSARVLSPSQTHAWGDWETVTAGNIRLATEDLDDDLQSDIQSGIRASEVSVRAFGNGMSGNPVFEAWSGTLPDGVGVSSTGAGTITKASSARFGNAIEIDTGLAPTTETLAALWNFSNSVHFGQPPAAVERALVTLDVELVSGDWNGFAVQLFWRGDTNGFVNTMLDGGQLSPQTGIVQRVEIYVDRPDTWVQGGADDIVGRIRATTEGGLGLSEKVVRVHRFDVEPVLASSRAGILQQVKIDQQVQQARILLEAVAGAAAGEFELIAVDDGSEFGSQMILTADRFLFRGGSALFDSDFEVTGDLLAAGVVSGFETSNHSFFTVAAGSLVATSLSLGAVESEYDDVLSLMVTAIPPVSGTPNDGWLNLKLELEYSEFAGFSVNFSESIFLSVLDDAAAFPATGTIATMHSPQTDAAGEYILKVTNYDATRDVQIQIRARRMKVRR